MLAAFEINFMSLYACELIVTLSAPFVKSKIISSIDLIPPPTVIGMKHSFEIFLKLVP